MTRTFLGFLALLLLSQPIHGAEQALTSPNGDVYIGEVKNGLRHGRGRMKYANGREYYGEWVNDLRQGYGEQTWKQSPKYIYYKGHWDNNLPEGTGKMAFKSGQFYWGEFKEARLHGQGTLTYANGDVRHGTFIQNKREGDFTLFTTKGRGYKETEKASESILKVGA